MDHFKQIGDYLNEVAGEVADFGCTLADENVEGLDPEKIRLLSETVYELTRLEKQNQVRRTLFADIAARVRNGSIVGDAEIFSFMEKGFDGQSAMWSDDVIEDDPQCRRVKDAQLSLIDDDTDHANDDLMISQTQAEISLKCPLTTKEFVNPIQSKKCGHTFEASAVESYIARKGKFNCPVQGCKHREVSLRNISTDFRSDKRMRRLLNLDEE
eukprot:m.15513 g.15513  ORF g.15513 m.15513 type:complete len:213 (-) comp4487_c0_seq1:265-903(-)